MTTMAKTVRIKVPVGSHDYLVDASGSAPRTWNGSDLKLQLGFFTQDGETPLDLSNIDSITVEIRDLQNRIAAAYVSKTIAAGSIVDTITAQAWADGTAQNVELEFTDDEMVFQLGGNSKQYWLVITAITTDSPAKHYTAGGTALTIDEDGAGTDAPAGSEFLTEGQSDARYMRRQPANGSFRTDGNGQHIQLYNATTGRWHTLGCVGPAGAVAATFDQVGEA